MCRVQGLYRVYIGLGVGLGLITCLPRVSKDDGNCYAIEQNIT